MHSEASCIRLENESAPKPWALALDTLGNFCEGTTPGFGVFLTVLNKYTFLSDSSRDALWHKDSFLFISIGALGSQRQSILRVMRVGRGREKGEGGEIGLSCRSEILHAICRYTNYCLHPRWWKFPWGRDMLGHWTLQFQLELAFLKPFASLTVHSFLIQIENEGNHECLEGCNGYEAERRICETPNILCFLCCNLRSYVLFSWRF